MTAFKPAASPVTSPPPARAPLATLDEALAAVLAQALVLPGAAETLPTLQADGRVLAADLVAPLQVPPHDNSAMDGYALRASDVAQPGAVLQVTQRIAAGYTGEPLLSGQAARIFTGAPLPPGADTVLMQEEAELLTASFPPESALPQLRVTRVPQPGEWVRRAGEDVQKGQVILARGHRLTPPALGLVASMGFATLPVARAPRVALFSTGDELVMPGTVAPEDMPPGAIYNSNRYVLYALLRRLGCEVSDLGLVPDTLAATQEALAQAAQGHDVVLTSGGVSVGEEDHIRPALQALGSLHLWQIAMKPGKPFAYGQIQRQGQAQARGDAGSPCHFLGLPGNPVSSFVTFLLLVRPFMLALQGVRGDALGLPEPVSMPVHFDWPRADKRREFVRVRRNAVGGLDVYPTQSSGVLTSAVWADGLLDIPAGTTLQRGDKAMYRPLAAFF